MVLIILLLSFIGTTSVSAKGNVKIKGIILGSYELCCSGDHDCDDDCEKDDDDEDNDDDEPTIILLSEVRINIKEIGGNGEVISSVNTTTNSEGYYEAQVLKGGLFSAKTYEITVFPKKMKIDGKMVFFPKQTTNVQVKLRDVTADFEIEGKIGKDSNKIIINPIISEFLKNLLINLKIELPGLF